MEIRTLGMLLVTPWLRPLPSESRDTELGLCREILNPDTSFGFGGGAPTQRPEVPTAANFTGL